MAHTKAKARRRPEGHASRENLKQKKNAGSGPSDGGIGSGNRGAKRKRNRGGEGAAGKDNEKPGNGAKRRKTSEPGTEEGEGVAEQVREGSGGNVVVEGEGRLDEEGHKTTTGDNSASLEPTAKAKSNGQSNIDAEPLVPIFPGLEDTHTVTTMSIISSSNINKKVSRVLAVLSTGEKGQGKEKRQEVVMLYAKAPVVSKVVSVAEIVKREIAKEGGKWFSYCAVGEVLEEKGKVDGAKEKEGVDGEGAGGGDRDGSEEAAFEVMKTPFERALESEGKPKIRAIPVMSLYLSRFRIEGLRNVHDEQTNAREVK